MEDFIYILLAIVWLVISILGGKKKKQAQTQKPAPEPYDAQPAAPAAPNAKGEFEEMLDDFFGTDTSAPKKIPNPETEYYEEEYSFEPEPVRVESMESIDPGEYQKYETKYSVGADYEFSTEGKIETLEDLINQYKKSDEQAEEEAAKLNVVDIDMVNSAVTGIDFDPQKAIIYSEIINRKY